MKASISINNHTDVLVANEAEAFAYQLPKPDP